jgi:putative transposase
VRRRRRPVGKHWFVDEVFLFRKSEKRYLYRAIDEEGVVVDVLRRDHRDTASAKAFFPRRSSAAGWSHRKS